MKSRHTKLARRSTQRCKTGLSYRGDNPWICKCSGIRPVLNRVCASVQADSRPHQRVATCARTGRDRTSHIDGITTLVGHESTQRPSTDHGIGQVSMRKKGFTFSEGKLVSARDMNGIPRVETG